MEAAEKIEVENGFQENSVDMESNISLDGLEDVVEKVLPILNSPILTLLVTPKSIRKNQSKDLNEKNPARLIHKNLIKSCDMTRINESGYAAKECENSESEKKINTLEEHEDENHYPGEHIKHTPDYVVFGNEVRKVSDHEQNRNAEAIALDDALSKKTNSINNSDYEVKMFVDSESNYELNISEDIDEKQDSSGECIMNTSECVVHSNKASRNEEIKDLDHENNKDAKEDVISKNIIETNFSIHLEHDVKTELKLIDLEDDKEIKIDAVRLNAPDVGLPRKCKPGRVDKISKLDSLCLARIAGVCLLLIILITLVLN